MSGPLFYWFILNGTWYQCLTGYYITNIPLYLCALIISYTYYDISEAFPYFQPIRCNFFNYFIQNSILLKKQRSFK